MKKHPNLRILLREPLLHFLLIGALLFLLYGFQNENTVDDNRIVISEADINRLILLWEKKWQRPPTQTELQGFIEQQIREEVMYREALSMGLDQNDSVVRRRLAQKVEFIATDLAEQIEPTDEELTDYLATHADKFEISGQISFIQIYFNIDRRGEQAEKEALLVLDELNQTDSQVDITMAGDPFMIGQQHEQITEHETSRLFGNDFAKKLFTLPDARWQGPIQSAYGLPLVRIDNKILTQQAELDAVRDKVKNEWFSEQRRIMDEAFYQSLRQRYEILIEDLPAKDNIASTKP